MNSFRVFLIGLAVFLFFMVIISVNVKKTSESSASILLRIFTNYAHILTTAISFSANQPDLITGALLPIRNIGDSSTAFVSFDCFVKDSEIKDSQKKRRIRGLRNKMKTRKGCKKNAKIKKFKVNAKKMELQNSSQRSKMRMMFSERLANEISENRLMKNSENIRRKIIEEKAKPIDSDFDRILHSRSNQISIIEEDEKKEDDRWDIFIPNNIGSSKDNSQEFSERLQSQLPRKYAKIDK